MMTTHYALYQHDPSGEVYAVRLDDDYTINGICGPLTDDDQDASGSEYDYDDQPDDTLWAQEIAAGERAGQSWRHLADR